MKIAIAGLGYVGLSNAVFLAQHCEVVALDVLPARVDLINKRQSPIGDLTLESYLQLKPLNLRATLSKHDADVIVVNRITDDVRDVAAKVYSRDLFGSN
jgi:UDPglucose 6-dehydrogenase